MKKFSILFVLCWVAFSFLFLTPSFGQQAFPKPGEVIDNSNYMKYKHLFSEFFLGGFENGWGGFMKPFSITVSAPEPRPNPKSFLKASEKYRGKLGIDSNGMIKGAFDGYFLPFPEVMGKDYDPNDKYFVNKIMWNYEYRYRGDDFSCYQVTWTQRKGEEIRVMIDLQHEMLLYGRLYDNPKPIWENPNKLSWVMYFSIETPYSMKNMVFLQHKYLDPLKDDDLYIYVPSLRRAIRSEAGQRSTPIQGAIQDPDDYYGLNVKTASFTYKFVREQKVLAVADNKQNVRALAGKSHKEMPYPRENWELRDVYVIDAFPKDPRYPNKVKRIYLDKENQIGLYYNESYDRAGKPWKLFAAQDYKAPLADGDYNPTFKGFMLFDLQFGMIGYFQGDWIENGQNEKLVDYSPSSLKRYGR